jgi:hypothetical protein
MSRSRSINPARNPQIDIVLHLHTSRVPAGTSDHVTLRWQTVYSTFQFEMQICLVLEVAAFSSLPSFASFHPVAL